jgi:hypothetical protein
MPRGKKQCPSCKDFLGVRVSSCLCGYVFPKKEAKKKEVSKSKINKRSMLSRLVEIPDKNKRFFYAREMKMLNDLCARYSESFMMIVSFDKKFDSLAYLVSPKLRGVLDQKFRAFNYVVDKDKYPEYNFGQKAGKDITITRTKKTTKDFLNE